MQNCNCGSIDIMCGQCALLFNQKLRWAQGCIDNTPIIYGVTVEELQYIQSVVVVE